MNLETLYKAATGLFALGALFSLAACGDSDADDQPAPPPAPPPAAAVTVGGIVTDGPVAGGTLFVFGAAEVQDALDAAAAAANRAAALAAANPLATLVRDPADADAFELDVPGAQAGEAVFLIFDNEGAQDLEFGDVPPNLESVAILGAAGTVQRLNVGGHATLIAQIVRNDLDPDGDGVPIDAAAIAASIQAARMNVLAALGADAQGRDLFAGEDPLTSEDDDLLRTASSVLGLMTRTAGSFEGLSVDVVTQALAADAADGEIDGMIPAGFDVPAEVADAAAAVGDFLARDSGEEFDMFAVGACSTSAVSLRRACATDVVDDVFETRARCIDTLDEAERDACLATIADLEVELEDECDAVFEARLALCDATGDAAHEPEFGAAFAANFVDPTLIGTTVNPNPYFPLVAGNQWVYEAMFLDDEGELVTETITVTVLAETKLIDGITCVTVNDVVEEDGVLIEDTDDWYAQDLDDNVWYCGEIAQNFELFDGDVPLLAELVDVEGSWKAGRDGAEAGILLPAAPVVGTTLRQEVLFGEAEDAIEILSITGTEMAPGGACAGDCLVTRDFTPLEPDAEENKYYAPGLGLIVELDPATGDRLELIQFTPGGAP